MKTVTFKRPEDFKRYVFLLTNATREGFKALGTDLAGKKQDNNWLYMYMQVTAAIIKTIGVCCHRITNKYKIEYVSHRLPHNKVVGHFPSFYANMHTSISHLCFILFDCRTFGSESVDPAC